MYLREICLSQKMFFSVSLTNITSNKKIILKAITITLGNNLEIELKRQNYSEASIKVNEEQLVVIYSSNVLYIHPS